MNNPIIILALFFIVWGIVSMIAMASYCSKRGIKVNWPLINLFFFRYVSEYKRLTSEENGKPGFWFYTLIVSFNSALILVLLSLLF